MNTIPGSCRLPGLALGTHVESLAKPRDVNKRSQILAWLDTHLVFSISRQISRCQQAFLKPCLVNSMSKDTRLVFSVYAF